MGLISWALLTDVYTQLFTRSPVPTHDFTGKTVLLTGANSGLGKEALYHLIRLGASQVIAAVRSVESGTAVKEEVERTTRRNGVIELLELDLGNYDSVKAFADNVAQRVDRLDHAVMNASIATEDYATLEGNESTVTVNVVSTVYLVLLLLPIMRASHRKYDTVPTLSVVSSGVHAYTTFPERKVSATAVMTDRYQVSKLLQIYAVREIADQTASVTPWVAVNCLDPGLAHTGLTRNARGSTKAIMAIMRACLAWTAEEGSRTLLHAVSQGPESHGVYISGCKIQNNSLDPAVLNKDGRVTQKRVWSELSNKLEEIHHGVTEVLAE